MNNSKSFLNIFILGLIILFFSSPVVNAIDYELLIITPAKYESVAQDFLKLHAGESGTVVAEPIYGCYVTMEDLYFGYDGEGDDDEPEIASGPGVVATLNEEDHGLTYENDVALTIIKFLRGVLGFQSEWPLDGEDDGPYAISLLRDSDGVLTYYAGNPIYPTGIRDGGKGKWKYLLLLGDTGAAGPATSTWNGIPESWYVYMEEAFYNQNPDADERWFPTDFFYASPDYEETDTTLVWTPNLRVGRIPIQDLGNALNSGTVTEIGEVVQDEANYNCLICDGMKNWVNNEWVNHDLLITSGDAHGASYLILENSDTCLLVFGDPGEDDVEEGNTYQIRYIIDDAEVMYDKCEAYMNAVLDADAWDSWYRKVVTAGGDSYPTLFSFWDEFVLAKITNDGYFEGNELIKLRHTNKDNVLNDDDFNETSLAPYFQDDVDSKECGLLFHLGGGSGTSLYLDGPNITATDMLGYDNSSNYRLPIIISNSDCNGRFDMANGPDYIRGNPALSFGIAAAQSPLGGAIAYIGSTDYSYAGIIPSFNKGVLDQERLYNTDELLSYTIKSFHEPATAYPVIGDLFMGSPYASEEGKSPIWLFVQNNDMTFWSNQKTILQYTLLGDPCLPIPHPKSTAFETGTLPPGLAFNENTLRSLAKGRYESHGIGVSEMPTGNPGSTTINITPVDSPGAVVSVKKTRVDIRRDTGVEYLAGALPPASYNFATLNTEPGYYLVKVEQPGWDPSAGNWGDWWEKETWIYVQLVNEFEKTVANDVLVVDDDFGYPIVTTTYTEGYEDWYAKSLDYWIGQGKSYDYDVWHVDFDDDLFNIDWNAEVSAPTGDDWTGGTDQGDTVMHGEVYPELLERYDIVIWLTGDPDGYRRPMPQFWPGPTAEWQIETITSPEQERLIEYLDNRGRLFLSGQGIVHDLQCRGLTQGETEVNYCYWTTLDNEFLRDYLKLSAIYSSYFPYGRLDTIQGIPNNPIFPAYYSFDIAGGCGAHNQYIWEDAEPDTDTRRVFQSVFGMTSPPEIEDPELPFFKTAATCHYQGSGANVFFPWGFEAIDNQDNRNEVINLVLKWLGSPKLTGEYAVSSDGDDDGSGGGSGGVGSLSGCFIATASYGTPMAEEVMLLSHFRDKYLATNDLGRFFVDTYYKISPPLASFISKRPYLKKLVRIYLKPMVKFAGNFYESDFQ